MSLKTTLVLLVLAAAAAGALWFLQRDEAPPTAEGRRVFPDLTTAEVVAFEIEGGPEAAFTVTRRDGGFAVLRKGDRDRSARAEAAETAVRAVASSAWLKTRPDVTPDKDAGFGLDARGRRSVVLRRKDGRSHRVDFGAEVRNGVVVALIDGARPAVELDAGVALDVLKPYEAWIDARIFGLDAGLVRAMRVYDRTDGRPELDVFKESARWFVKDPEPVRADQVVVERMAAYACAVESAGVWPDAETTPPRTRLRVAVETRDGRRVVVAVGEGARDGVVPARREPDGPWERAPEELVRAYAVAPSDLRTRRLFDVDAHLVAEVITTDASGAERRYLRRRNGFAFTAPEAWEWRVPAHLAPGADPASRPFDPFPLDPTAATRLTEGLADLEVVAWGGPAPASADLVAVVRTADAAGVPLAERRVVFGPVVDGRRRAASAGANAEVRASDVAFLERPFHERLARTLVDSLPHCITEVEVTEPSGRVVRLKAAGVASGRFVYERVDSAREGEPLRLAPEASEALRAKLASLTVKEFVGFGPAAEGPSTGLATPRYVVRFKDTVQAYEGRPELDSRGAWFTWRIGAETEGKARYGACDRRPGLVFLTEPRDLDPVLDLLNLRG